MTAFVLDGLETKLANLPDGNLCVAFSGGMDSSALLHALATSPAARSRNLRALHINHRLHANSMLWSEHCIAFASALNVPVAVVDVTVDRHGGTGPEDAARRARFAAFAQHVRDGEILALAHHRDDQVETVLLKLLRGAGPEGLGGMRELRALGNGFLWRPLLDVPHSALAGFARDNRLTWIDDPSNADTKLRRNFLRTEILPRLTQRWSDASTAISHSAAWMRAASDFIGDEAQRALTSMRSDDADSLRWDAWLDLPAALRDAVLRLWLRELDLPAPAFFHVEELERQLRQAAQDRAPCISWPGCEIRRYRQCIYAMTPLVDVGDWEFEWRGGELALPTGDTLAVVAHAEPSKPLTWTHALTVRNRRGGERLKPVGHSHHRDVRLLLQESAIAPWRRSRIPMIFAGDELIALGDLFANDTAREWLNENQARIVCGVPLNSHDRH